MSSEQKERHYIIDSPFDVVLICIVKGSLQLRFVKTQATTTGPDIRRLYDNTY
jgi:hypothetical protein